MNKAIFAFLLAGIACAAAGVYFGKKLFSEHYAHNLDDLDEDDDTEPVKPEDINIDINIDAADISSSEAVQNKDVTEQATEAKS